MIAETQLLETLRLQAWERAKAELKAMLHTYYAQYDMNGVKRENGFDRTQPIIEEFISRMDDEL